MAVTQLLARISPDRLTRCSRDWRELDRLISFEIENPEDDIDLDWSPNGLMSGLNSLGADVNTSRLNILLGEGANVVNQEHPTGPPDYFVYSPITYVTHDFVKIVSSDLSKLNPEQLDQMLSHAMKIGLGTGWDNAESTHDYYSEMFEVLRNFVEAAANTDQAIVAWWD